MNAQISLLSLLLLLFLSSSPIQTLQASAVSVITNSNTRLNKQKVKSKRNRLKKQRKSRLKYFKNTQTDQESDFGATFIKVFAIAWYPISIGLLITALVLGITPLLIVSIVLLALPIFCAIVIGLIFLIGLMTFKGSLC